MLELARGISQWPDGLERAVIFLFNTGEEEGLNGAHSFITQHPWSKTIRVAIDLEAMGIGGKSIIFQNDKLELLKTRSLQHLGGNMFAFLFHIGASSHIPEGNSTQSEEDISKNNAIYFDILSLIIWVTSLVMGGIPAAASLALSCLNSHRTQSSQLTHTLVNQTKDVMQELQEMKEQHEDWRSIALEALSANQALQTRIRRSRGKQMTPKRRLEDWRKK
ncbi:hypothetical protein JHK84_050123 [Glycine max]|nr:hypothetical protein JHK84_050123 [Glycine max]